MKKSHKHERGGWASDLSQDELEKQKVALEIEQLREPWWKRPGYLAIALPGLLAFATLIVGVSTGFFRNQYDLIQIKNEKAGLEQRLLEQDKQKLNQEKEVLKTSIGDLEDKKRVLTQESLANQLKFQQEQQRLSGELQKINNDRLMVFSEAQEKRQKLEKEERQLLSDFQTKKEELTNQLAPLNEQISHLKNENFLIPFRHKLAPTELSHQSYLDILPMLRTEKDNVPLYLGVMEQALESPGITPRGRGAVLQMLYAFSKNEKWWDLFDRLLKDQVEANNIEFVGVPSVVADDLNQRDRYRLSERIIELMMQRPTIEGPFQTVFLGDIVRLLEKEKKNHIKSFTRRDRFFDILQTARDACLRQEPHFSGVGCEALTLLAPEGAWLTFAQQRTAPGQFHLDEDLLSQDSFKDAGVKLSIPGPNDVDGWKKWLTGHQELKELWFDDKGLQRLRANPSLLSHF